MIVNDNLKFSLSILIRETLSFVLFSYFSLSRDELVSTLPADEPARPCNSGPIDPSHHCSDCWDHRSHSSHGSSS